MEKKYCSYLYWILQIKAIEVSYYFYQTMQEDINITYSTVKMQQLVYCMVLDQFIKRKLKRRNQNNFLATCSHQRQAALRADNKKQIQNRFDGTSAYITVTGLDEP